jgi:hypothetical protein
LSQQFGLLAKASPIEWLVMGLSNPVTSRHHVKS